ncbi:MAG: alpha/beta hydrolase [Gammaproteobacteria bacterium]|nr:alpha/beta hydrolase [Gammaproteobacteria bacterium]
MSRLALPDATLNYVTAGEGANVVLLHGLGANLAFWFPAVAPSLARRFHVLAYDLRGHGRSSMPANGYRMRDFVDDLRAVVDSMPGGKAHIIGHSFGARVALHFAAWYGDQLETLTLADTQLRVLQPPMRLKEWSHWASWKQQLRSQGVEEFPGDEEIIDHRILRIFSRLQNLGGTHAGPAPHRRRMGRRGSDRWEHLMATSAVNDLEDEPVKRSEIANIRVPVLGLFGERSHCLGTGEALAGLLPDYRLVIVPRVGHFHPAVRPGVFVRIVGRFLADPHRPLRGTRA